MMNEEDPRLTAYVLGEADSEESRQVSKAIAGDARLQRVELELQESVVRLRHGLAQSNLALDPVRRAELYSHLGAGPGDTERWRKFAVVSGMAACLCVGVSLGLLLHSLGRWSGVPAVATKPEGRTGNSGNLLSFGFRLEPERAKMQPAVEAIGGEMFGAAVQQPVPLPKEQRLLAAEALGGVRPDLPESSLKAVRVPDRLATDMPGNPEVIKTAEVKSEPRPVGKRLRVAGDGKAVFGSQTSVSGVLAAAAVPAALGNPAVWGGRDPASVRQAYESLAAVSGALKSGHWPEPGSFSVADLVSAYANLTESSGGGAKMDFRFAAAVASFGTLLERREGARSRLWDEVLDMAGGTGAGNELRQGFVGLVEDARKLAR